MRLSTLRVQLRFLTTTELAKRYVELRRFVAWSETERLNFELKPEIRQRVHGRWLKARREFTQVESLLVSRFIPVDDLPDDDDKIETFVKAMTGDWRSGDGVYVHS